jgi:hypothetical protein
MKLSKSTVKLAVAAAGVTVAAASSIATADSAHAFTITTEGPTDSTPASPGSAGNFNPATNQFTGTLSAQPGPGNDNTDLIKFTLTQAVVAGGQIGASLIAPFPTGSLIKFALLDATNNVVANGQGANGTISSTGLLGPLAAGDYFLRIQRVGNGNVQAVLNYQIEANLQPVPEPISMLSGAAAIATAGMMRRKKKLQQQQAEA